MAPQPSTVVSPLTPPPCHRAHTPDCIHTPTHRGKQPHAATDSQTPPRSTQPALQRSPTHPGHSRTESNGHGKIEDGIFMASWQPVDWPLAAAGCAHLPRHSRDISHLVISHPIYRRRFQIPSYAADSLGPVPGSDLHLCTLILKPQTVPSHVGVLLRAVHTPMRMIKVVIRHPGLPGTPTATRDTIRSAISIR